MPWFNLDFPIGWDELGVIATTIAVIVALVANHNANVQLKKSLQMHEQTKGVELLDERIDFVNRMDLDEPIQMMKFEILFDENIIKSYSTLMDLKKKLRRIEREINDYDVLISKEYGNRMDDNAPMTIIKRAEAETYREPVEEKIQEFENICKKYEYTLVPNGQEQEEKVLNYKTLRESESQTNNEIREHKKKLHSDMVEFIKKSIAPLSKVESENEI